MTDDLSRLPSKDIPRECRRRRKGTGWVWKERYATEASARLNAHPSNVVYRCGHCGFWHRARAHDPEIGALTNRIKRALHEAPE